MFKLSVYRKSQGKKARIAHSSYAVALAALKNAYSSEAAGSSTMEMTTFSILFTSIHWIPKNLLPFSVFHLTNSLTFLAKTFMRKSHFAVFLIPLQNRMQIRRKTDKLCELKCSWIPKTDQQPACIFEFRSFTVQWFDIPQ